jgi:uncharacterized protein
MKKKAVDLEAPEKIIGRQKEQELLRELIGSNKSEFIAIYGRRRVGKTYLIKNLMSSIPCVFFHVTGVQKGPVQVQLKEFAKQIGKAFYQSPSIVPQKNWFDTFEDLTDAINEVPKDQTVVLFFDELPWMATPRSKILVALELYWNRYRVFDRRVKLIICGSSTSWIINDVINNKGGLHNRVTRTFHLQPFSLFETESYLKEHQIKLNRRQILDLYTVLGGVPLYWSFIRKGRSAHQCIDELCFQQNGSLVNEFGRLFESLFEDSKPYVELIRIISEHRYGIGQSELIALSKQPNGGGTIDRLHELEEAGFVTSLVPYGHKDRGVYYVMDDEYSLFYLRWIQPHLKTISKKETNEGFWQSLSNQPTWRAWAGYAFQERLQGLGDLFRKPIKEMDHK